MNSNIKSFVEDSVRRKFPSYPVVIKESPEDGSTLWVMVFAVPVPAVAEIENYVDELELDLPGDEWACLLPMVKNLETTRKHYPEHMPVAEPTVAWKFLDSAIAADYFRQVVIYDMNATPIKDLARSIMSMTGNFRVGTAVRIHEGLPLGCYDVDVVATWKDELLVPSTAVDKAFLSMKAAANDQLALAA